jgi:predicted LPLAT superfamily acyltransferase
MDASKQQWFELKEVGGSLWHFRFMLWITCHLPLRLVEFLTAVVCFFFWLGAAPVRARSAAYLKRLYAVQGRNVPPFATYRHVLSFALSMIEKLLGWRGVIKLAQVETQGDDLDMLVEQLDRGEGAFLICSHLGNMEMLRSLTGYGKIHTHRQFTVHPVVDFSGTSKFNALLYELNPDLMNTVVDANKIGVDSAVGMKDWIASGDLVVIAGDRTSANSTDRNVEMKFLGETANFPEGAFTLASILNAPIYFAFAIRKKDFDIRSSYEMHIVRAKTSFDCSRKERLARVAALVQEYVGMLEKHCLRHPYQWYNFYNFWHKNF